VSAWSGVLRGESTIDFVGRRRRFLGISAALVAVSLLAFAVRGLNLGLEFTGGVAVSAPNPAGADLPALREAVAAVPDARVQLVDDGASVLVQTGPLDPAVESGLVDGILRATGAPRGDASLESVGPTFGALLARQALVALGAFLAAAALFISWRLQWKMAAVGIVALLHDLVLTTGIYAVTGFDVTPATVVALLTILGYSLYDTVVVFDRIEELEGSLSARLPYSGIVNRAMNQVLVRSLATSFTSLLPVGALLVASIVLPAGVALRDFSLALFVGIAAGTYSSVGLAAPLLAAWKEREPEWADHRRRLEEGPRREARPADPGVTPRPPRGRR